MKRKFVASILSFVMMITSGSLAFAIEGTDKVESQSVSQTIESITGTRGINDDLVAKNDSYIAKGDDINISVPKYGDGLIKMGSENLKDIGMSLPKEFSKEKATVSKDGTITYGNSIDMNSNIGIQAIKDTKNEETYEALRVLITINNKNAKKEYSFKYNLPDGYRLITDKEYSEKFASEEEKEYYTKNGFANEVYIIDSDGLIMGTIDPAWAKDANGKAIETFYKIRDNELIQVINFDENSAFPIVADPTHHPNKTSKYYLTKKGIKKLRDSYTKSSPGKFYSGLISLAIYKVNPIVGTCNLFIFINKSYSGYKYNSWNMVYVKFKKKYAKVSVVFRWRNGGKNSGYVPYKESVSYVNRKGA